MSENDILRRQEDNGQKEFYLILVGQFYHAYGNGAFALSRVSGYRVIRKSRKWGDLLMAGFPASCLEKVKQRINDGHGSLRKIDDRTMIFGGVDGTPDEAMVTEQPLKDQPSCDGRLMAHDGSWVFELMNYNLVGATPLDAMNFLARLQAEARKELANGIK